jgi:2,3-bisphosphoglycerate-dependent phosphoglycerate mutase
MDLLLIRHGEPVRIENIDTPADPPLHGRGRKQSRRLADWLASEPVPIDAIWASPLRRAVETAEPVATQIGVTIQIEQHLAEWDRHATEYIPIEELRAAKDERWEALVTGQAMADHVDPDTFRADVVACVEDIVRANAGRRVAVICHGGVINAYLSSVLGLDVGNFFLPNYTSISRVAAARTGVRSIVSINESSHLRGLPGF